MSNPPNIPLALGVPVYLQLVVTANSVDPATGLNPGVVDATTPLAFTFTQGVAFANVTELAPLSDGTRVVKITAGANPPGGQLQNWSFKASAAGRTGTTTVIGSTPPAPDVSGVAWNNVAPSTTLPT